MKDGVDVEVTLDDFWALHLVLQDENTWEYYKSQYLELHQFYMTMFHELEMRLNLNAVDGLGLK
jgi:hypothetical protein